MTLTDFLLSRVAEDEDVARAAEASDGDLDGFLNAGSESLGDHYLRHRPGRVLADCDAKRRIVEHLQGIADNAGDPPGTEPENLAMVTHVLALLALPYAGHADYREEWRP